MKILCICPIGIGNYILAYPAFRELKARRPADELHLLALRAPIVSLARIDPIWAKVHLIDPTKEHSIVRQLAFFSSLRKEHFSTSISFFPANTWQYNFVPFFCGIPHRYAFKYRFKKFKGLSFLADRKVAVNPLLHDIEQNFSLIELFTKEKSIVSPTFPSLFTKEDAGQAANFIATLPVKKPFIGIHPGSSAEHGMSAKRWAPERFGALADFVCKKWGASALVFGGPDESSLKETVAATMHQPCHIVKPLDLRVTAAQIKECALFLCNDSGLMHIAACQGVPTAAVFGPTDELRNGPRGAQACIIRKEAAGFPLWTAANVGDRSIPPGVDPQVSLDGVTIEYAWDLVSKWMEKLP